MDFPSPDVTRGEEEAVSSQEPRRPEDTLGVPDQPAKQQPPLGRCPVPCPLGAAAAGGCTAVSGGGLAVRAGVWVGCEAGQLLGLGRVTQSSRTSVCPFVKDG